MRSAIAMPFGPPMAYPTPRNRAVMAASSTNVRTRFIVFDLHPPRRSIVAGAAFTKARRILKFRIWPVQDLCRSPEFPPHERRQAFRSQDSDEQRGLRL